MVPPPPDDMLQADMNPHMVAPPPGMVLPPPQSDWERRQQAERMQAQLVAGRMKYAEAMRVKVNAERANAPPQGAILLHINHHMH